MEGLLEMKYSGGQSKLTIVQERELKKYFEIHQTELDSLLTDNFRLAPEANFQT